MPQRGEDDQSFTKAPPNPYIKVSQHTKDKLAFMVVIENYKVSSAAKILKIHQSTAKMTMRAFKLYPKEKQQQILRSGAIKKKDKMKMEEIEKEKIQFVNPEKCKNQMKQYKNIKQKKEKQIKAEVKEQITDKNLKQQQNKIQSEEIGGFFFLYVPYFYPWNLL